MNKYHQPLMPGQTYHLFSRAVGNEKLFISPDNYSFFLRKLKQHTWAVCQFYCYTLLPNHFHLLVRIKDEETIIKHFEKVKKKDYKPLEHDLSDFIMERFSNFLNSYAKAFNKMQQRKGALFIDYLKRSKAEDDDDLTAFIWYIHKNAVHHKLAKDVGQWPFDSYSSILSDSPTWLLQKEVLDWFGSRKEYIKFHQQPVYPKKLAFYID